MDVVLCVALKECIFLKRNIYFIKKNLSAEKIWIITDKRNFSYIPKDESIVLINENTLIDGLTFSHVKRLMDQYIHTLNYGWYFQQFLKLGFALSNYAKDEYLVWDSDTVPLSELTFKDKGKDLFLPKTEHNDPYFKTIDRLFQAPQKSNFSFIAEHMLFRTSIVKEMLSLIEANHPEEGKWFEICLKAVAPGTPYGFSEFETYGTYCLNYHADILELRKLRTFRRCSKIYGIFASKEEIEELAEDLDTGSFEVYDYPIGGVRRYKQLFINYLCKVIARKRSWKG